jgi:hypothetical protein
MHFEQVTLTLWETLTVENVRVGLHIYRDKIELFGFTNAIINDANWMLSNYRLTLKNTVMWNVAKSSVWYLN